MIWLSGMNIQRKSWNGCLHNAEYNAPHGFGDGTGTDVEGWPDKAIDFLEAL